MRVRDWQSRLAACMRSRALAPFDWGRLDCVTFAADCVESVIGRDPIADVRGAWTGKRQACRLLGLGGGLSALATERLGACIQPAQAQPGDVGLSMQGEREALCVFGGTAWHMPGDVGLVSLSQEQVLRAWRCEVA